MKPGSSSRLTLRVDSKLRPRCADISNLWNTLQLLHSIFGNPGLSTAPCFAQIECFQRGRTSLNVLADGIRVAPCLRGSDSRGLSTGAWDAFHYENLVLDWDRTTFTMLDVSKVCESLATLAFSLFLLPALALGQNTRTDLVTVLRLQTWSTPGASPAPVAVLSG